jgi:RNA polymerase sigma-70 factor, ECF subfamily
MQDPEQLQHHPGELRWELRNQQFAALIEDARDGSIAAFEQLYDASARWLLSVVRRIVDDGQAEDVLTEVYFQVWKSLARYDPLRSPPAAWLAMIARSRALDHLRRERHTGREEPPSGIVEGAGDAGPEEILTRCQQSRLVRLSVANLDRQERLVIALAYFQDCTQSEIARRTGLPLGTVKASMTRAQHKLRSTLLQAVGDFRRQPSL